MRRASRVDTNQPEIVAKLREYGCLVLHLHTLGRGVPDICVGYGGRNYLFEIKDPRKPPSQRKLTSDENEWHLIWKLGGQVNVIETALQAIKIIEKDLEK